MEEEETVSQHDGASMLYDYFKHLTSLCLFSLAGVAALSEKVHGRSTMLVLMALLVIGATAFGSFLATGLIVASKTGGKPLDRSIHFYRTGAPALLSFGIGVFLYVFVTSMKS
ncbi:hypothetical protein [Sphingomonas sp. TDK1]|uniref:hypothetical protein n=1 Tax=Sphingomonas sp. TDK1 TaxID=453247 RepID=UPI0007D980EF|nr:hypothetical protein [Sphingomonas sp. TDK1]OAN66568.1 hypothetical protein A7X12_10570 [Sphingomonas sp. TDK1]